MHSWIRHWKPTGICNRTSIGGLLIANWEPIWEELPIGSRGILFAAPKMLSTLANACVGPEFGMGSSMGFGMGFGIGLGRLKLISFSKKTQNACLQPLHVLPMRPGVEKLP